ncbi:hypothetical protein ACFLW3_00940 [Chloroflexota bacterium]
MSKLRIIYIVSLAILGILVALTVFRPMVSEEELSAVTWGSVISAEDRWIIEFEIFNQEGKEMSYIIIWSSGEDTYSERVSIKDRRTFTCIHDVYPAMVKEGKVNLIICKEGEATSFEQATYYIQF